MVALLLSLVAPATAASLGGVTLPDTATVGGQNLVLNGIGLREKFFFDIYVGGLYLPAKTTSATAAIEEDVPKRLVMHFIYSEVTAAQLVEAYGEGTSKNPAAAAQAENLKKLHGWMEAVHPGDEVAFDYVPGTGTAVTVKGAAKGTIPGADFMKVLWTVYLGPNPPTGALRSGMLGG